MLDRVDLSRTTVVGRHRDHVATADCDIGADIVAADELLDRSIFAEPVGQSCALARDHCDDVIGVFPFQDDPGTGVDQIAEGRIRGWAVQLRSELLFGVRSGFVQIEAEIRPIRTTGDIDPDGREGACRRPGCRRDRTGETWRPLSVCRTHLPRPTRHAVARPTPPRRQDRRENRSASHPATTRPRRPRGSARSPELACRHPLTPWPG